MAKLSNRELREAVSKILVKWGMPTVQVAISEIVALLENEQEKEQES